MALVPITTFGQMMANKDPFMQKSLFADAEAQRNANIAALQNTALGVSGRLKETELAGQFGLQQTELAGQLGLQEAEILADAQKKIAKINADASGSGGSAARRAGLLSIATQGLGGLFRPAGQALGINLGGGLGSGVSQNLGNFNTIGAQLQQTQQLAGGFTAGSAGQTQRALLNFPRPALLN